MKRLSVLFAAVIMLLSFGTANAQKMATIDVGAVLNLMPEKKKADDQLQAFSSAKQAEIQKQAQAAQALYEKYATDAAKQTAEVNKAREEELKKLQENLQKMSQAAQKDFNDKQDAAYAPIEEKFNAALTRAAKANGWDFVFDVNTIGLLYKGGADATAAVKKELGL